MATAETPSSNDALPPNRSHDDLIETVLISEAEIRKRVLDLGRKIEADYHGKPLTIVAVLTGSLIFLADVIRQIRIPHQIAIMQASSYRGETTTADKLIINPTLDPDVSDRDVLLIDDILDTGKTLSALVRHLRERGARSVRTAVLLHKQDCQQVPFVPDYSGFTIPDKFVVGYGLDYNGDFRHLPYIGILRQ